MNLTTDHLLPLRPRSAWPDLPRSEGPASDPGLAADAGGAMGTEGLQLQGIACERGGRLLFSGLHLHLAPGELLHVKGANGSGKTTLLRIACGLRVPHAGAVRWPGQDAYAQEDARRHLLYIGHLPGLKDELTPCENLQATCALNGRTIATRQARLALMQAGLGPREDRPVRGLSQGQRRRAALARLPLSADSPLWVLDEPFTALDTAACTWLGELLALYLAQGGMVALTSHQDLPRVSRKQVHLLNLDDPTRGAA